MTQFYVYLHVKPNGDPFYVGKGCGERAYRLRRPDNKHHTNVVSAYGRENITVLIFNQEDENTAFATEIGWIAVLREEYHMTNRLDGGDSPPSMKGHKFSTETRARMSAAKKLIGITPEMRAKLTAGLRGLKPSNEKNAQHSAFMMGKAYHTAKHSAEAKAKMSRAHKGCKFSDETKAKMSEAQRAAHARRKHNSEGNA